MTSQLKESVFLCKRCGTSTPAEDLEESFETDEDSVWFKCPECQYLVFDFWMPNLGSDRVSALESTIEEITSIKPLLQNVNSDDELEDIVEVLDNSLMKLQSLTEDEYWDE